MPVAGARVANDLSIVCNEKSCSHLNDWLNELYLFKQEYKIYRSQ